MEKVVIIGGVAAGPKTACHYKRLKPKSQIIIIDQDNLISYGGCGIPYLIGGEVADEQALRSTSFGVVRDEEFFIEAKGLEMKTCTRVLSIDRKAKTVLIENVNSNHQETVPYDKLVLATGTKPNVLPIPGTDLKGVFTIGSLNSAIQVQQWLKRDEVAKAVVIGGGAIGIEMAEGLEDMWGLETTIVEYMPQLLPNIADPTYSQMLAQHLKENNIDVFMSEAVTGLIGDEHGQLSKVITDKREIEAQLVIMATGVRPRDELARDADLLVSPRGGIVVNNRLQTSDPDIYAAGDCIETTNLVSGSKTFAPLGSLANRQGRVVGDNLAGVASTFDGVVGSFIMKAYDRCIATAGLTLEAARSQGFNAEKAVAIQSDRAHFIATQETMSLTMIFDKNSRRVLGVQGFGSMGDGVMARINASAALLAKKAVIEDFSNLEMAYAPPFSTAMDILNATANIADNIAHRRFRALNMADFVQWMENPESHSDWVVMDVRSETDSRPFTKKFGDRWITIPYPEMRNRYQEAPKGKKLIIICGAGTRSYEVQNFLDTTEYDNTLVLAGGLMVLRQLGLDWVPE